MSHTSSLTGVTRKIECGCPENWEPDNCPPAEPGQGSHPLSDTKSKQDSKELESVFPREQEELQSHRMDRDCLKQLGKWERSEGRWLMDIPLEMPGLFEVL